MTDANIKRLYGPGAYIIDSLGNLVTGTSGGYVRTVSQRFRAPVSGSIASLKTYWADGSGYAAGNGGSIRIRVYPDDGSASHRPNTSGSPLASGQYQPSMQNGVHVTSKFSDSVAMTGTGSLTAGNLYHIVYDNVDSNPSVNYLSVNCAATTAVNGRPTRWLSPIDWGMLYSQSQSAGIYSWQDITVNATSSGNYYAPILQVTLRNGSIFGNSNMETGNVEGRQWDVNVSAPVRERFTPSTNHAVTGFSVDTAATVAGALQWQLMNGAAVLASGTITDSGTSYATSGTLGHATGVFSWRDVAFPAPVTLQAGSTYDLVFTGVGSSSWRFADQRNGSSYGYAWPAAFSESQAQAYTNGSWLNANHWDHTSSAGGSNWRVVLQQSQ